MKDLTQYPVSFPYGSAEPPYSTSKRHHGEDRAAPEGVSVVVAGVSIGLVGNTGYSTGPHCHIDKNTGSYVNPSDWVNIKQGIVTFAGYNGTAGNQVSIEANGATYRFLHLSKINVTVGQKIGVVMGLTREQIIVMHQLMFGGLNPGPGLVEGWTGRNLDDFLNAMKADPSYKKFWEKLKAEAKPLAPGKWLVN